MKHIQWYEIIVKGHLDPTWVDWFEGWSTLNIENGQTLLLGPVQDQAALHGLLTRIRDMNVDLIALKQVQLEDNTVSCDVDYEN